jgi:hypothetical protein
MTHHSGSRAKRHPRNTLLVCYCEPFQRERGSRSLLMVGKARMNVGREGKVEEDSAS